jgi:hypothetical protein
LYILCKEWRIDAEYELLRKRDDTNCHDWRRAFVYCAPKMKEMCREARTGDQAEMRRKVLITYDYIDKTLKYIHRNLWENVPIA